MNQAPVSVEALFESSGLVGRAVARAAAESDAIDGVRPHLVIEPESAEALAAVLAWASKKGRSVVLRGGGTKLSWGRRPTAVDCIVSTRRLNKVLAHQYGDLTATVEAGATLNATNRELAQHGQWLPLDTAFDDSTIGGILASNDSGPLRHRHGTPRDLLIGIRLATADGRLVKAGGNVVKNVAGYDLGKLMTGSWGSFAAIVSATFKLAPRPAASKTFVAEFSEAEALTAAVGELSRSQLEPAAFELVASPGVFRLVVQFASAPGAVEAQVAALGRLIAGERTDVVSGGAETDLWLRHARGIWAGEGAVVRISWRPSALPQVLALLGDVRQSGAAVEFIGRAGVGAGLVRVDASPARQLDAIARLRARPNEIGNVVLLRAGTDVKAQADVWALTGDSGELLRAVKQAFDPAGILNAGRGPV